MALRGRRTIPVTPAGCKYTLLRASRSRTLGRNRGIRALAGPFGNLRAKPRPLRTPLFLGRLPEPSADQTSNSAGVFRTVLRQ